MKLKSFIKEIVIISIVLISQGSVGQVPYERILNAVSYTHLTLPTTPYV